ncbi:hydroperoxide isomerase ALOXE3-like [Aulostomus maculatus]
MTAYTLEVTTGSVLHTGTFDHVYVTLIGTEGQSERTQLTSSESAFPAGKVGTFSVTTLLSLGCLLLLKLEKDPFHEVPDRDWFCSTILVKTPEDDEILFPCHQWLSRGEHVELRGGRATKAFEDDHPCLEEQRKKELVQQKLMYKWHKYAEGMSYILNIEDPNAVPPELRSSFSKSLKFNSAIKATQSELEQKGLSNSSEPWESFEAMKGVSWFKDSAFTLWKNDDFFGYQFLNGVNPLLIRRCSKLPANFPVTDEMVKPFLANGTSLTVEREKGNIFIADYKILEGLPTTVLRGKPVPLAAALCLLYMNPEKKLLPVAIQLGQQPSEENPIFLPSDTESDWLLAKIFMRNADTIHHQLVSHLQKTHLLAEVFAMATLRNLPRVHPLHKIETYTIKAGSSLGKVLLVKVEKDPHFLLSDDDWYCSTIRVTDPEGCSILFPCYRWVSNGEHVELRGGKAMKVFEVEHPILVDHREQELKFKKDTYKWKISNDGLPHLINLSPSELPAEVRFSKLRSDQMDRVKKMTGIELLIKGLIGTTENWENIEDTKNIFWFKKTNISEYVAEHWKDDDFYAYQFLNGINPNLIKRCSELPPNFPVTDDMLKPFLKNGCCLQWEMTKGNIFLCDLKKMDGIAPQTYNGERLHVTPGLCLFYLNQENKLLPVAIQLQQQPSEQNPIFLPSDSDTDWLLAKMFFKNADLMDHQAVHHLMKTHYLAEVFAISTVRNFPVIHPIYKLLIPHFRYTLHINTTGRLVLFGPNQGLSISSLGQEGITELMRRSHAETTYSSLCLPDDITARGLESIPNFYYRDDGLKLWNIINGFVKGIVEFYYPSDSEVEKDCELQEWICEIFTHGFLGNTCSGIPQCFHTAEEVTKFITMVIFNVSAQHAAVNNGQYDYFSFIPNGSILLRKPPPTTKGQSSIKTVLETLPNIDETVKLVALLSLLSQRFSDAVLLGSYPEERFDESLPQQIIKEFQAKLSDLSEAINSRNSPLEVPYTYLNPTEIENSITI